MKLVTYIEPYFRQQRVGALIQSQVVDLTSAYARFLKETGDGNPYVIAEAVVPASMLALIQGGERTLEAVRQTINFVSEKLKGGNFEGVRGETIVFAESDVKLMAPVPRPGKIIHTAGNFREHAREGKEGGWDFQIPPWISFLKCTSAIIGHEDNIIYPQITQKLDHEIEIGIIIGKGGRYISEEQAWDHIFGFTIFIDITARDIQHQEMSSGLLNLGKNLDTFAVFGPSITLRDDIGDVHNLAMELRVNGDPRQVSNTNHLAVKFQEIVSHWSVMSLEPGDIISTGTVAGVAAFRPDPDPYWLRPGDVVECEIENIGLMRNYIVEDELTPEQKQWLERRKDLFDHG